MLHLVVLVIQPLISVAFLRRHARNQGNAKGIKLRIEFISPEAEFQFHKRQDSRNTSMSGAELNPSRSRVRLIRRSLHGSDDFAGLGPFLVVGVQECVGDLAGGVNDIGRGQRKFHCVVAVVLRQTRLIHWCNRVG